MDFNNVPKLSHLFIPSFPPTKFLKCLLRNLLKEKLLTILAEKYQSTTNHYGNPAGTGKLNMMKEMETEDQMKDEGQEIKTQLEVARGKKPEH